ncbi:L-galactonate oxidoreductase [soil metagenome]
MIKTRSAYLNSPWKFELRDIELPDPPAGFALVKIDACGICGTDLTTAGKAAKWQPFGHEVAGTIHAIAPGESHLKVGATVVLESSSFCGTCELCRDGRVDLCNKAPNFWGQPAMGFSRYMLAPVQCIVPYDGLSPEAACLAEPGGVAVDMVKTANIQLGDSVCVIGPGPIGLMAAAIARHSGATRIVCVGHAHSKKRLDVAARLGCETVSHDGSINELTNLRRQFQHVLLTAPVQHLPPSLSLLAYGGILTYIGIGAGDGNVTFDANDFHFRKLQLRSSFASPAIYYPTVLRLLKAGILPSEELISHRYKLEQIDAAMKACRDDKGSVVKVVVSCSN